MEFGRTVMVDEVEGDIVTCVAILGDGATEHEQLSPALEHHRAVFGRAPGLVAGDRGMHSPENERLAREAGVRHLAIPRGGKTSPEQRVRERDRTWHRRYRGRAGIGGRIHSLRRVYGQARRAYHGPWAWPAASAGARSPATCAASASTWPPDRPATPDTTRYHPLRPTSRIHRYQVLPRSSMSQR